MGFVPVEGVRHQPMDSAHPVPVALATHPLCFLERCGQGVAAATEPRPLFMVMAPQ
jgi:hypothetical protein